MEIFKISTPSLRASPANPNSICIDGLFFYLFIDTFLSGNELLHQEVCIYIYIQENEKALQWGSHIMFMII